MSHIDSWFLNLTITYPVTLRLIKPCDQCIVTDPYFTPSSLKTSEIVEILYRLFQDGFLLAITPADFDSLNTYLIQELLKPAFIPSLEQIKAGLTQGKFSSIQKKNNTYFEDNLYFFLTKKGGKQWEYWCKPKWNHFFLRCINSWDSVPEKFYHNSVFPHRIVISCTDKKIGEKIIVIEHLLDTPQVVTHAIKNSEIWETLTPWHPTYWKTLPQGYVVSYQIESVEKEDNINESQELTEEKRQAREWYNKIVNWYTKDLNNL